MYDTSHIHIIITSPVNYTATYLQGSDQTLFAFVSYLPWIWCKGNRTDIQCFARERFMLDFGLEHVLRFPWLRHWWHDLERLKGQLLRWAKCTWDYARPPRTRAHALGVSWGGNAGTLSRRRPGHALIEYTPVEGEDVLFTVRDLLFEQFDLRYQLLRLQG